MKQALRDWFEAARKGSEGVSGTEIVDAVITLGLNYDYKQVHRPALTVARAATIPAEKVSRTFKSLSSKWGCLHHFSIDPNGVRA